MEIALLLGVFILYLASNQESLKYVVDLAIKDKNISYSSLSGSLLDSIKMENIRYKDIPIAKSADISWSIRSLIESKIIIKNIDLKDIDVSTIEKLISDFDTNKSKKGATKLTLPDLELSKLSLSLIPYKNRYIDLKRLKLNVTDLKVDNNQISISNLFLNLSSNLADIKTDAHLQGKSIVIESLDASKINIGEIEKLIKDLNSSKNKNSSSLIEEIKISRLNLSTLPFQNSYLSLKKADLYSKDIDFMINDELLNAKDLSLYLDTDIATLRANGYIKKNRLFANTTLNLYKEFIEKRDSIFDLSNINPIKVKLEANKKGIDAKLTLKSPNIFKKSYKIAVKSLFSDIHYDIKSSKLLAKSNFILDTKYASQIKATNYLKYDKKLSYQGDINISKLNHFPKFSLPLFNNATINYKANEQNLTAILKTDKLNLLYKMFDYKKADFYLKSKELNISNYFKLPKQLSKLKAKVDSAFMRLDFHKAKDIQIDTNISSNALNLSGVFNFKDGLVFNAKTTLPKESILKEIDKNLKFEKIFPSTLKVNYKKNRLWINNSNDLLTSRLDYDLNSTKTKLEFKLDGNDFLFDGDLKKLGFNSKIYSLKEAQKSFSKIYEFKSIPLDGELDLNCSIQDLSTFDAKLQSRWLVYEYKLNKFAFAEKIKMDLSGDKNSLNIDRYDLHSYILDSDRHIFSNKSSHIGFNKGKIIVNELWINDSLHTKGRYDLNSSKGEFITQADRFHYVGKEGKIDAKVYLKSKLFQDSTSLKGHVTILDALLTYKYKNRHEVQDPDIIIIQEQKKIEEQKKQKATTLVVDISIDSKKAIRYKRDGIDIYFKPDLKFWKEKKKEMELLGRIEVLKGSYEIEDKEFKILPGELLFGGDILNPYLQLRAKYFSDPYDITINITGRVDAPVMNFSSTPYLSQSDILSLVLFNSKSDELFNSNGNSSNMAISFFGNRFAKEIVGKFGIKLDKLVILTNENGGFGVEIGKKISKRATIIYINDIVQTIKVKYQNSDHFETDLTISPESSGIDFIYKKER